MNVGIARSAVLGLALCFPAIAGTGASLAETGCTHQQLQDAKDVTKAILTVADLLCLAPFMDDVDAAMKACDLREDSRPLVDQLLAQKRAARKAGMDAARDAGAK